jgi:hypothetical protein
MFSMVTAVILSAVALDATSHVSEEPMDRYKNKIELFEDAECDTRAETPPDEVFLECLSAHESSVQEDAALWETEVAARRADIRAKGDLAIVFGLVGVTLAVCAVAVGRGGRTVPEAAEPTPGSPRAVVLT